LSKTDLDRLNDTLAHLRTLEGKSPALFAGVNVNALGTILRNLLQDDYYLIRQRNEISQDISLGGFRLIKTSAKTELRHTKRLLLLLYRVLGYNNSQQTRQYKEAIRNFDEARTLASFRYTLNRIVNMSRSFRDWLEISLPRDGGRLVHYYNQGEDNRLQTVDFTENGWCLGVSTQWLRFKATGEGNFWNWMRTQEGAAAMRFIMAAQGVRVAKGADLESRAEFALKKRFGIIKVATLESIGVDATPANMAWNCIVGNTGAFVRLGMYYVEGGGHAMAATTAGQGVSFMDPNAGEVHFEDPGMFSIWFPKYARRIRYHFHRHYAERMIYDPTKARVEPPPPPPSLEQVLKNALSARRAAMRYDV
jgi:hypothetical protein